MAKIDDFNGCVFDAIKVSNLYPEEIVFCQNGEPRFVMHHEYSCCESVSVEEIIGDLNDLIGEPIIEAECVTYDNEPTPDGRTGDLDDFYCWTFYKLGTRKGHVTIRWLGESNGYYSVEVDIRDCRKEG